MKDDVTLLKSRTYILNINILFIVFAMQIFYFFFYIATQMTKSYLFLCIISL